jgi:hypothetical protein
MERKGNPCTEVPEYDPVPRVESVTRRKLDAGEVLVTVSATAATWAFAPFIQSMAR